MPVFFTDSNIGTVYVADLEIEQVYLWSVWVKMELVVIPFLNIWQVKFLYAFSGLIIEPVVLLYKSLVPFCLL